MRRNRIVKSSQRGMTLVEIMVVIAIIGLVMGAVVVGAFPQFKKAQCKTAWTETQSVQQAIIAYQKREGLPLNGRPSLKLLQHMQKNST